jgi:murein DD-endopeptidase MepM/ murein hydrolase activator NlpD
VGAVVLLAGLACPQPLMVPVRGATARDWNPRSFWASPWGRSGVHKGIDIFASAGAPVRSASSGIVLFRGSVALGGNVLLVLGPKWRVHYYAHLSEALVGIGRPVSRGQELGRVGNSGNAKGKPFHLHYAVVTLLPYLWRWDRAPQGWKKVFFLDPDELLRAEGD